MDISDALALIIKSRKKASPDEPLGLTLILNGIYESLSGYALTEKAFSQILEDDTKLDELISTCSQVHAESVSENVLFFIVTDGPYIMVDKPAAIRLSEVAMISTWDGSANTSHASRASSISRKSSGK